ncbi:hypothetical protein K7472_27265 [Streptomyces sp. PTM05]|uniref:NADH dehydrogenase subunit 6 n=1 Tax=Streptantibioticus parmotrematis TaxID=2873249 RepID=A0ABS7R012_9ACTN|nr:hypothetical protein [Streptantibioticus parmotrematis]MBY8888513.1 hypothetical protein [Streptantibioticus parmotrematis]
MVLSLSALVLLGAAIFALWRYGRIAVSHVVLCTLFGFLLASSSLAPYVGATVRAGARFLGGIHP